jgi:hypothetical protein
LKISDGISLEFRERNCDEKGSVPESRKTGEINGKTITKRLK